MTRGEVETLATILANDGGIACADLGRLLSRGHGAVGHASAYETGRRRAAPLLAAGAVERPVPGVYALTEKGRIAAALLMCRDPGLAAALSDGGDEVSGTAMSR